MTGDVSSAWPAVPASGTNAEFGVVSEKPLVTAQFAMTPEVTEAPQAAGKAGAIALSKFSEKVVTGTIAPKRAVKVAVPRLEAPSWSWSVAVTIPPQAPIAVKLNGRVTAAPPAVKAP